jgi:ParB family transcriptional regulator, chromosome partitioning protein
VTADEAVAAYAQVVVPINDIDAGERDRLDMGDLAGLAASIRSVGLLHPVVITADWQLVAGDRRLAAVRELGWREVPVTIVDLTSAGDVLKAEIDENTCRKDLTPDEASKVRQRRARVLAQDARRRQGERVDLQHSPNLGGSCDSNTDSRTAKMAALGTGYSGSTLDKVDGIREIAERGVIRLGDREIPAPEPVRDVARAAMADLQRPGTPVDRVHRAVAEAIERHVEPDAQTLQARQLRAWREALHGVKAWREFDLDALPDLLSDQDWDRATEIVDDVAQQVDRFRSVRPTKLRVADGGSA